MVEHSDKPISPDPVALVALDVDGTLLRSDGTVDARDAAAIRGAQAMGVKVVLATARPPRGCVRLIEQLELPGPHIHHNGALVYDARTAHVVHHEQISGTVAREVMALARSVDPSLGVGVELLDEFHADTSDEALKREPSLALSGQVPGGLGEALKGRVTKVVLVGHAPSLSDIQLRLQRVGAGKIAVGFTHMRLLSVVHANAGKAAALKRVAEFHGLSLSRVMAVGDAPNDLDMMRAAGLAVAVENAWEQVLRAAHFTVASNDAGGVAQAIERFVLAR